MNGGLIARTVFLEMNCGGPGQFDNDRYFHIAFLIGLRPDGVGAGWKFDLLRGFIDAAIMVLDPLHHFAVGVVDAVTGVEVGVAAFTLLRFLSGGKDLEVSKGVLARLSGVHGFHCGKCGPRRGLPLQEEATQKKK